MRKTKFNPLTYATDSYSENHSDFRRNGIIAETVGNNMTQNNEKTTEFNKTEILTNLLWTEFGIIGGISYYSKSEYLICGIMVLIGILYAYKLIKL